MLSKDGRERQTGHGEKGGGHLLNMAPEAMYMSAWTQTQSHVVQPRCISHAENEIEATICWPWGAGGGRETSSVLYQNGPLWPEIREALLTLQTELHWHLAGCAITMPCWTNIPCICLQHQGENIQILGLKTETIQERVEGEGRGRERSGEK